MDVTAHTAGGEYREVVGANRRESAPLHVQNTISKARTVHSEQKERWQGLFDEYVLMEWLR